MTEEIPGRDGPGFDADLSKREITWRGDVGVGRIDLENAEESERLAAIDASPKANRHVMDEGDEGGSWREFVQGGEPVYGIFRRDGQKARLLTTAYFYPAYGDEDFPSVQSEEIQMVPEEDRPTTKKGKIDKRKIHELSVAMPEEVSGEDVAAGLKLAMREFGRDKPGLIFFYQMLDQNESVASGKQQMVDQEQFARELAEEQKVLEGGGFTARGEIVNEEDNVHVFTVTI